MDCTVFCSFDNVDTADLAVGRLRAQNPLIKSVKTAKISADVQNISGNDTFLTAIPAFGIESFLSAAPLAAAPLNIPDAYQVEQGGDYLPSIVNVRIVCPGEIRQAVESQLFGLGASHVRWVENASLHKFL